MTVKDILPLILLKIFLLASKLFTPLFLPLSEPSWKSPFMNIFTRCDQNYSDRHGQVPCNTKQAPKHIKVCLHPPYSLALALNDFWLSLKIKMTEKDQGSQDSATKDTHERRR